jgi:DNA-3-methyladenine glycosylase I
MHKSTVQAYMVFSLLLQPFTVRSAFTITKFSIHLRKFLIDTPIKQIYPSSSDVMTKHLKRSVRSMAGETIDGEVVSNKEKKSNSRKKKSNDTATITIETDPIVEHEKAWYTIFTKGDIEYDAYMANEWGYEKHDDQALFEKLSLEGAQAGLTWRTILHKREAYRKTFYHFDPIKVAVMTESDIDRIINEQPSDPKNTRTVLVRHRGKIESVINNAKCVLKLRNEYNKTDDNPPRSDIFAHYLWSFVDHKPILYYRTNQNPVSKTTESEAMSAALKKYGFKFVGPTICYSMMQALGMVIDHPYNTPEWQKAYQRLQKRPGGYQERK